MMDQSFDVPDLLRGLDAVVRCDGAPPLLEGRVAVGLTGGASELWWVVDLGERAQTSFARERPKSDAALTLDPAAAHAIARLAPLPSDCAVAFTGDPELLRRFFARYLEHRSWLTTRIHAASEGVRR